ncbi:MAG: hypothetical protein M3Z05_08205 [Gemmatimonadota bacterium]|nr:hypothetical protein [Gemmatimonadota bacterium]
MKKQLVIASTLVFAATSSLSAQGLTAPVPCTVTGGDAQLQAAARDACQQTFDVFEFMAPQLGISLAGGNATLGTGSTLGGLGHFSIGVRGNIVRGIIPRIDQFTERTGGATPAQQLPSKDQVFGLPTADAAIGLFAGLPLALTNVGGIDLLLSATYVPTIGNGNADFSLKPKQNLQVGYGVRLGLLSESILVPGVSFTYLKRDLPSTTISGTANTTTDVLGVSTPATASLSIANAKVNTSAWRLVASKGLLLFGLAAGVGQDTYSQNADVSAVITSNNPLVGTASATLPSAYPDMKRTNYFVDASLNLPLFKIVGELGQVTGGTSNTYNSIGTKRADRGMTYGSVGLRFAL